MSDDLTVTSPIDPTPRALMGQARALNVRATDKETGAESQRVALSGERTQEFARRRDQLTQDTSSYKSAAADLDTTQAKGPEKVAMPDANLGPMMDPGQTKNFLFSMLGLALVGAKGSRSNFKNAVAGLTGAIKGYKEGSLEAMKEKQAEFKRNFDIALEKQRQATAQYEAVIKSKTMSLNQQMEMIRIHAVANENWDLESAARTKDIDSVYKLVGTMRSSADKLETKAIDANEKMLARREKAEAKRAAAEQAAGGPDGLEAAAWDRIISGHAPPAKGGMYQKVMGRIEEIAKANGMTSQDLMSASADVKSKLSAKRQFEVRAQNMLRAENQLSLEIPVMEDAMSKLDLPSIPAAARGKIAVLREMGDPNVTRLDQAAETVFNEFEGIITGNPGTLNVQDVQQAQNAYHRAQTPEQMKAAIDGMRRIIGNAKKSLDMTRHEIMGDINASVSGKRGEQPASSPQAKNAKGWALHTDAQGNKAYVSPDGKQFEEVK